MRDARHDGPLVSGRSRSRLQSGLDFRQDYSTQAYSAQAGREGQILPTRSIPGVRVSSPSSHLAGQTSPGWAATYWAAWILRIS